MNVIEYLRDRVTGKAPKGAKRHPGWRETRRIHIEVYDSCAVCGTTKKLEVHHIYPFHLFPERERDPKNLITLCRSSGRFGMKSCHRFFGHLGDWKKMNPNIVEDAFIWKGRLE